LKQSAKGITAGCQVADDTPDGCSAGVITKDIHKAFCLAEGLEADMVHVNDSATDADACCPFGGWKDSGRGREGGHFSIEQYSEMKWLTNQKGEKPFPF